MSKLEEFRKALDVPIRNLSVDVLVREICHQPECFEAMYRLMSDEKQSVAWRATWVCEKLSEIHPAWFIPLYDDLVYRLSDCKHQGSKRLLLSILYNLPVTAPVSVELLNYSLDHIKDLAKVIPDLLVVSGLAYGIDICAHRNALYNRLPTVAVLAHGLDRIYPSCHRNTAVEMLESGGLLTDFPSGTEPDRPNFLRRNRIVAGISDCTIVVESAEKGGSLVTADIAFSYGRDVYSFPGRVGDSHSKGCNNLIRQNKAGLITSADDLLSALCWDIQAGATPVQTELFFAEAETFTSEQNPVLAIMRTRNEIHINELASVLEIPVHQLSMLLFELEINGKVKALPGNLYKLS